jgi:hypothetical protein
MTSTTSSLSLLLPNVSTAAEVITMPSTVTARLLTWCRMPTGPSTPKVTLPLALVPVTVVSNVASTVATPADATSRNAR